MPLDLTETFMYQPWSGTSASFSCK